MAKWLALFCLFLSSCSHNHSHDPAEEGHAHESSSEASSQEKGHEHGGSERSLSAWSSDFEVFLAFSEAHLGEEAHFYAHLTDLKKNQALAAGHALLSARSSKGTLVQASSDQAKSQGIWPLTLTFPESGLWQLALRVTDADGRTQEHELGNLEIGPEGATPSAEDQPQGIAFSKELQWSMRFETQRVTARPIKKGMNLIGQVRARMGAEAWLIAPTSGQLLLHSRRIQAVAPGSKVAQNQVLAELIPFYAAQGAAAMLNEQVTLALSERSFAQSERDRIQKLVEAEILPARRLAEAELALERANTSLAQVQEQLASRDGKTGLTQPILLKAPFEGTLLSWASSSGAVEAGQKICQLADLSRVWLELNVPESELGQLGTPTGARFEAPGAAWLDTADFRGKLVSIGDQLDPLQRTLPVIFEMDQPQARVPLGVSVRARLEGEQQEPRIAIPSSALYYENGRQLAIVQLGGELFEKRPLTLGIEAGEWREVRAGLAEGERIVVVGVDEVALAAAAGSAPAHGHSH